MSLDSVEKQFQSFSKILDITREKLDIPYLDSIVRASDYIFSGDYQGNFTENEKDELSKLRKKIDFKKLSSEDARMLMQFLLIQAYQKEKLQANKQMTPDTMGMLVEHVLESVMPINKKQDIGIMDLTVGTSNLLSTVLIRLLKKGFTNIKAYGIDNDDVLLTIASLSLKLEKLDVKLAHQDALDTINFPKVDYVISDLPVGYYPNDKKAKNFKSHFEQGNSYAHYLLIEQALRQLKDGGFGLFLVPFTIFKNGESQKLIKVIQDDGYFQGLLKLPRDLFVDEQSQKAILIVQKKGNTARQSEVFIGDIPSVRDKESFKRFLKVLARWTSANR